MGKWRWSDTSAIVTNRSIRWTFICAESGYRSQGSRAIPNAKLARIGCSRLIWPNNASCQIWRVYVLCPRVQYQASTISSKITCSNLPFVEQLFPFMCFSSYSDDVPALYRLNGRTRQDGRKRRGHDDPRLYRYWSPTLPRPVHLIYYHTVLIHQAAEVPHAFKQAAVPTDKIMDPQPYYSVDPCIIMWR